MERLKLRPKPTDVADLTQPENRVVGHYTIECQDPNADRSPRDMVSYHRAKKIAARATQFHGEVTLTGPLWNFEPPALD